MTRRASSKVVGLAAIATIACGLAWVHAADEPIDMQRARTLHQRMLKGEKLTAEEQAYHDRAQREMERRSGQGQGQGQGQAQNPGQNATAYPAPPPTSSTGLTPLTELGAQTYKGEDGGLYGGGSNEPP